MLTTKKIILALVAVTLTCLVPTLALGQDAVLSVHGSGAYNVGYFVNANMGFPDSQVHVGNPGSTGGFGSGDPGVIAGGDLCANIYVFNFDQQMEACCSCRITPNGMQGFSVQDPTTGLTANPLTGTSAQLNTGAIKIVSSFGGGHRGAGLPPTVDTRSARNFCDAGSNYWPQGRLESWITHVRPLGNPAFTVTEIDFQTAQLSWSELKKLEQQCFAITADPSEGGLGSGHGTCTCDPEKTT
jgi:hypothetical protein